MHTGMVVAAVVVLATKQLQEAKVSYVWCGHHAGGKVSYVCGVAVMQEALRNASSKGDLASVQRLLALGVWVNTVDEVGQYCEVRRGQTAWPHHMGRSGWEAGVRIGVQGGRRGSGWEAGFRIGVRVAGGRRGSGWEAGVQGGRRGSGWEVGFRGVGGVQDRGQGGRRGSGVQGGRRGSGWEAGFRVGGGVQGERRGLGSEWVVGFRVGAGVQGGRQGSGSVWRVGGGVEDRGSGWEMDPVCGSLVMQQPTRHTHTRELLIAGL